MYVNAMILTCCCCRQSHILRRITDTDAIVQLIMDPMQLGHNAKEFVLLASHHFASCDKYGLRWL